MNRKFIISAIVSFVLCWGLSFVVHGLLLGGDYAATAGMRPPAEAQRLMHFMILAQALIGVAFAWTYVQGKSDKPWLGQGVRFGLAIACLTVIPTYLIYHVVTPIALAVVVKQIIFDTIRVVLMGIAVAWINR